MERLRFFTGLFNDYVMNGTLAHWFLLICLLWVTAGYAAKRRGSGFSAANAAGPSKKGVQTAVAGSGKTGETGRQAAGLLLFACAGDFFTVSKTALLLGDTSNRYQLPVYGMIVLLLFQAIRVLWQRVRPAFMAGNKHTGYLCGAAAAACLLIDMAGLGADRAVFLYPEDKEQTDFAMERAQEGTPVVYLYEPGAEWCIWAVTDELLAYPEIYFAAAEETDQITEEKIQNADALAVYIAEGADDEAQVRRILDSNPGLSEGRLMFEEKYCRVYYVR